MADNRKSPMPWKILNWVIPMGAALMLDTIVDFHVFVLWAFVAVIVVLVYTLGQRSGRAEHGAGLIPEVPLPGYGPPVLDWRCLLNGHVQECRDLARKGDQRHAHCGYEANAYPVSDNGR